ncbi:hypothetical protein CEXT_539241 [Caerostris extrusa]|uniref:Uncharacterized protein n=1 Tax=Caerostris extrusa TaxID=172846 RepID=A0AAV4TU82_CAEEX|nr:hypothetical protein CEXT_539241 [Caerostris extrusa]
MNKYFQIRKANYTCHLMCNSGDLRLDIFNSTGNIHQEMKFAAYQKEWHENKNSTLHDVLRGIMQIVQAAFNFHFHAKSPSVYRPLLPLNRETIRSRP